MEVSQHRLAGSQDLTPIDWDVWEAQKESARAQKAHARAVE